MLGSLLLASPRATAGQQWVEVSPLAPVVVNAGGETPVRFNFRVTNGYHINSNKPVEPELIPAQLHFSLPGEVGMKKLQYPAGQLLNFPFDPSQKLSVYSGDVVMTAVATAAPAASSGTYTVHAKLRYQACDNNACLPPAELPFVFDVRIMKRPVQHPGHQHRR